MRVPVLLILLSVQTLNAQRAKPGELLTAQYGANGTWNLYMVAEQPLSWGKAQELAAGKVDPTGATDKKGHLATISSGAENTFVSLHSWSRFAWIGFTDDPKFPGAKRAAGSQVQGWVWVTGEPVTWTNWQSSEPSDNDNDSGRDADGVVIENGGFWNNRPNGAGGKGSAYPFVIEWDIQSPKPVAGAREVGAMLPRNWPVPDPLPDADVKRPWVCYSVEDSGGEPRIGDLAKLIQKDWDGTNYFRLMDLNFRMEMAGYRNSFGWLFGPATDYPGGTTTSFGMLARARLKIPKAGTWSFNIHADDCFAMRLSGHSWKAVQGSGGIDPCDNTILFGALTSSDTDVRGVLDLPAGEVPVEVFYVNGSAEGCLQIMAAEGDHRADGATDRWRLLGHKPAASVPWPGISAEGWKVSIPPPGDNLKETPNKEVLNALVRVENPAGVLAARYDLIHFHDPECSRRTRFPIPAPFPNDPPGAQDDRVILAEGDLVIPADGVYNIGIAGDDLCALEIAAQTWTRIARDAGRGFARITGASISVRRAEKNVSQEVIGEIKLARGNYPIRTVSWDRNGASVVSIFGAPAGWPARLLKKNGAGIEDDIPGLEVLPFKP